MRDYLPSVIKRCWSAFLDLIKIMIPVMIIVRVAMDLGIVKLLYPILEPVMFLVGLPPEAGVIWATAILTGVYGGIGAFTVLSGLDLTIAQLSTLCAMILFAHGLPLEQAIVYRAGGSFWGTSLLRIAVALIYGIAVFWLCKVTGILSEAVDLASFRNLSSASKSHIDWAISSAISLGIIFLILLMLMIFLDFLEKIGFTNLLIKSLEPVLRFSGLNEQTTPVTTVGILLGLSYGGGLIIQKSQDSTIDPKMRMLALYWLSLCHSFIKETGVMLAVGGNIWIVFVGRFLATLLIVKLIAWFYDLKFNISFRTSTKISRLGFKYPLDVSYLYNRLNKLDEPILIVCREGATAVPFIPANAKSIDCSQVNFNNLMEALPQYIIQPAANINSNVAVSTIRRFLLPMAMTDSQNIRKLLPTFMLLFSIKDQPTFFKFLSEHSELLTDQVLEAFDFLVSTQSKSQEGREFKKILRAYRKILENTKMQIEERVCSGFSIMPEELHSVTTALNTFIKHKEPDDLSAAISVIEAILERDNSKHIQSALLGQLSILLSIRAKLNAERKDLDQAIALARKASNLIPEGHTNKTIILKKLADYLSDLFTITGKLAYLEEAVEISSKIMKTSHDVTHQLRPQRKIGSN